MYVVIIITLRHAKKSHVSRVWDNIAPYKSIIAKSILQAYLS